MSKSTSPERKRSPTKQATSQADAIPAVVLHLAKARLDAHLVEPLEARAAARIPPPSHAANRFRPAVKASSAVSDTSGELGGSAGGSTHGIQTSKLNTANAGRSSSATTKKSGESASPQLLLDKPPATTEVVDIATAGKAAQALADTIQRALRAAVQLQCTRSTTTQRLKSDSDVDSDGDEAAAATSDGRHVIIEALESALELATRSALETLAVKGRIAKMEKEMTSLRADYAEATDVSFAADARISELFAQLNATRAESERLQQVFDRRMLEVESTTQPHTGSQHQAARTAAIVAKRLETYRAEDIRRLEDEIKSLYAILQRQETANLARNTLQEKLHRLADENTRATMTIKDLEAKNEQLLADVRALLVKVQTQKETFDAERLALTGQLAALSGGDAPTAGATAGEPASDPSPELAQRQQQPSRQPRRHSNRHRRGDKRDDSGARVAALAMINARFVIARYFTLWRIFGARRAVAKVKSRNVQLERDGLASREVQTRKLVAEKKDLAELNSELHARIDTQHKHIERLAKDYAATKAALEIAEERLRAYERRDSPGEVAAAVGMTSEELQVASLRAYNVLLPVLEGVKRRLKLDALSVEPLRMLRNNTSTDHVASIVVTWINDSFSFLQHLLSIDDRLAKANIKVSFLSIQLRTKINRARDRARIEADLQKRTVLRRQEDGYQEILDAAASIASHIRSTRTSLFTSASPAKRDELSAITKAFEADIEEFFRRLKRNESIQFQLGLQMTRMENSRIDSIRTRIEAEAAAAIRRREDTVMRRSDSAVSKRRAGSSGSSGRPISPSSGAGALVVSPIGGEESAGRHVSTSSATNATNTATRLAPLARSSPSLPTKLDVDPYEHRKHHSLFINAIMRAGPDGCINHNDFRRLLQEEEDARALRRRIAVAPEMLEHQRLQRVVEKRREAERKERAKERALRGGLQHFAAHCGAVIPFRSNSVRALTQIALPPADRREHGSLIGALLGDM